MASWLPCCQIAKGSAFLDPDFERIRIDLADGGDLHPRQIGDALTGRIGVEADERGPAIKVEPLQYVDLRGLLVAGDADLVDGEAETRGDRLCSGRDLATEPGSVEHARR